MEIDEARAALPHLVRSIRDGTLREVVIDVDGRPAARLVACEIDPPSGDDDEVERHIATLLSDQSGE